MKVVNIGQLSKKQVRELNKKVKRGLLVKGKDYNYPRPKTAWTDEYYINFIPDKEA
jgi:hypothetical protein